MPNLGSSLRHVPDPARSPDPEIRRLVSALATLELAPPPRPEFRSELRAQLVAVAPRLVEEGRDELETASAAPAAPTSHRRQAAGGWRRPLALAVSAFAVVLLAVGGLIWASQSALPGTALYGVKRTAEGVELSLASGPVDKAKLYLGFATTRANEVSALLGRPAALGAGLQADGALTADTAALVRSTLASADEDVRSASQLLTDVAERTSDPAPLALLTRWAHHQHNRLNIIAGALPHELQQRARASTRLVDRVQAAAETGIQLMQTRKAPPCAGCPATSSASQSRAGTASPAGSVPAIVPGTVPGTTTQPGAGSTPEPALPSSTSTTTGLESNESSGVAPPSSSSSDPTSATTSAPSSPAPAPPVTSSDSTQDPSSSSTSSSSSSDAAPTSSLPASVPDSTPPTVPSSACATADSTPSAAC